MNRQEQYAQIHTGSFLIAEPFSEDPYFKRSVVLVTSHSQEATTGLIVNKELTIDLCNLVDDFPRRDFYPFLGGPVRPSALTYLHRLTPDILPGTKSLGGGYYLGGYFERLKELVQTGELESGDIRFFLGAAGWSGEQFREEFDKGYWGVAGMDSFDMRIPAEVLWFSMVEASPGFSHWALIPEDAEKN